jgi:hypothetical protein
MLIVPSTVAVQRSFVAPRSNSTPGATTTSTLSTTPAPRSLGRLGRGHRAVSIAASTPSTTVASTATSSVSSRTRPQPPQSSTSLLSSSSTTMDDPTTSLSNAIAYQGKSLLQRLHERSLRDRAEHARTVSVPSTTTSLVDPMSTIPPSSHYDGSTSPPGHGIKRARADQPLSQVVSPSKTETKKSKKPFLSPLKKPFVSPLVNSSHTKLSFAGRRLALAATAANSTMDSIPFISSDNDPTNNCNRSINNDNDQSNECHQRQELAAATITALQALSDRLTMAGYYPPVSLSSSQLDRGGTASSPILIDDTDDDDTKTLELVVEDERLSTDVRRPPSLFGSSACASPTPLTDGDNGRMRTQAIAVDTRTDEFGGVNDDDASPPSPELNPLAATQHDMLSVPSMSLDNGRGGRSLSNKSTDTTTYNNITNNTNHEHPYQRQRSIVSTRGSTTLSSPIISSSLPSQSLPISSTTITSRSISLASNDWSSMSTGERIAYLHATSSPLPTMSSSSPFQLHSSPSLLHDEAPTSTTIEPEPSFTALVASYSSTPSRFFGLSSSASVVRDVSSPIVSVSPLEARDQCHEAPSSPPPEFYDDPTHENIDHNDDGGREYNSDNCHHGHNSSVSDNSTSVARSWSMEQPSYLHESRSITASSLPPSLSLLPIPQSLLPSPSPLASMTPRSSSPSTAFLIEVGSHRDTCLESSSLCRVLLCGDNRIVHAHF